MPKPKTELPREVLDNIMTLDISIAAHMAGCSRSRIRKEKAAIRKAQGTLRTRKRGRHPEPIIERVEAPLQTHPQFGNLCTVEKLTYYPGGKCKLVKISLVDVLGAIDSRLASRR